MLALLAITAYESYSVVAPNERGVQVMLGEVTGSVLEPGVHFHPPFVSVIKKYSIVPKSMNINFSVGTDGAITKDMQTVGSQVTVFYRYDGAKIMDAVTKYTESLLGNVITKSLIASIKESIGKYSIYELVENQDKITADVSVSLKEKLAE